MPGNIDKLIKKNKTGKLCDALSDRRVSVEDKCRAIQALGDLRASEAVGRLFDAMDAKEYEIRHSAAKALYRILSESENSIVKSIGNLKGAGYIAAASLKDFYREQAKRFWRNSQAPELYCDDCNATLNRTEGYLRPGNYLACERCTDSLLSGADWERALNDMNGYFGPGLPRDLLEHVDTARFIGYLSYYAG